MWVLGREMAGAPPAPASAFSTPGPGWAYAVRHGHLRAEEPAGTGFSHGTIATDLVIWALELRPDASPAPPSGRLTHFNIL
jgi:hypothetical protein